MNYTTRAAGKHPVFNPMKGSPQCNVGVVAMEDSVASTIGSRSQVYY